MMRRVLLPAMLALAILAWGCRSAHPASAVAERVTEALLDGSLVENSVAFSADLTPGFAEIMAKAFEASRGYYRALTKVEFKAGKAVITHREESKVRGEIPLSFVWRGQERKGKLYFTAVVSGGKWRINSLVLRLPEDVEKALREGGK